MRWSLNLEIYFELKERTCRRGRNDSRLSGCCFESHIEAEILFLVIFLSVVYPCMVLLVAIFWLCPSLQPWVNTWCESASCYSVSTLTRWGLWATALRGFQLICCIVFIKLLSYPLALLSGLDVDEASPAGSLSTVDPILIGEKSKVFLSLYSS